MLTQPYTRLNVFDYVQNFCGWDAIAELLKYADTPTKQLYILSLIKTGGRAGEVLALSRENFTVDTSDQVIYVQGMPLFKRWRTVRQNGVAVRQHIQAVRKTFPVLLAEPLSPELLQHLTAAADGLLFRSPYKIHAAYTVNWGYHCIRSLSDAIPKKLFKQLGLNQPFYRKVLNPTTNTVELVKISDSIHLWQHWFRAQRASQLRAEYGYSEADLMEYFGWIHYGTALHYSRLGASNLAAKAKLAIAQKQKKGGENA